MKERSIGRAWLLFGLIGMASHVLAEPLTLTEVEQRAARDPGIERFRLEARGHEEEAVAAGTLPDPQLMTEIMQFPLDRPGFQEDEMTQLQLGLRQTFPRGSTRHYRSQKQQALASAQQALAGNREKEVIREARSAYLQLLLEHQRLGVLKDSRELFENLVAMTERSSASGLVSRQDVMRAELEMERLEDRILEARQRHDRARASLARWIGDAAYRPLPEGGFPELPDWKDQDLTDHPRLAASRARMRAGDQSVALAEEAYKPEWSVQLGYGVRTNTAVANRHRLGAMISVDLPLFTGNRQDRRLAARQSERDAAVRERDEIRLALEREVNAAMADLEQLRERDARYRDRLLEVASANAEAAEKAYSAGTTDFTALMESRLLALETRLESLRLTAELKQARAQLLYLLGEDTP
ncbi:hypothetical protein CK501_07835 [Halovibrio salipaludis]|uniref:Transporter n=1 Tax=Halovibrio salipaludis TaxID=2032626 RepID=A0A2A2F750_9GAMM|nr:TolC family protein [Halovibrio salipaludis]PAU80353.1 hypothetical protein CK501_07835 [Halovibrio salipaludis]